MQIDIYSIPIIVAKVYKRLMHKELPPPHSAAAFCACCLIIGV